MPETITLTNPSLPGRSITVRANAVPHYARSGWTSKPAKRTEHPVRLAKTADTQSEPKPEPDDQSADNKEN